MTRKERDFRDELERLLNKYSMDNQCGIPDFILADHVVGVLLQLETTIGRRETWFGRPAEMSFIKSESGTSYSLHE